MSAVDTNHLFTPVIHFYKNGRTCAVLLESSAKYAELFSTADFIIRRTKSRETGNLVSTSTIIKEIEPFNPIYDNVKRNHGFLPKLESVYLDPDPAPDYSFRQVTPRFSPQLGKYKNEFE